MAKASHRKSRKSRPLGRLLTPAQRDKLGLLPRMHLHLLCAGQGSVLMAQTVAAFFNLGAALAFLRKDKARAAQIHHAQDVLLAPVKAIGADYDGLLAYDNEAQGVLKQAFNMLEGWLSMQNHLQLLAACDLVEQADANTERQGPLTEAYLHPAKK